MSTNLALSEVIIHSSDFKTMGLNLVLPKHRPYDNDNIILFK